MSMFNNAAKGIVPNIMTSAKSLNALAGDSNLNAKAQHREEMEEKAKEFAGNLFKLLVKEMLPKNTGMMGSGAAGQVWNSFLVDAIADAGKGRTDYGIGDGVLRTLMKNQEVEHAA